MDNQEAATKPPKRIARKRRVVLIILLLLLVAVGGAAYALRSKLAQPVEGQVVPTQLADTQQAQVELAQYDGTTFSFVHPLQYIEQTTKHTPVPDEIESHTFVSSGMVSKVLQIVVVKLPSGNLNDDQSYVMRTQDSTKYRPQSVSIKAEKVVLFTANDGQQYQQSAYWTHSGKLLVMSMTGMAADAPALNTEFSDMIHSVTWR